MQLINEFENDEEQQQIQAGIKENWEKFSEMLEFKEFLSKIEKHDQKTDVDV